jgi:hypothetical protein
MRKCLAQSRHARYKRSLSFQAPFSQTCCTLASSPKCRSESGGEASSEVYSHLKVEPVESGVPFTPTGQPDQPKSGPRSRRASLILHGVLLRQASQRRCGPPIMARQSHPHSEWLFSRSRAFASSFCIVHGWWFVRLGLTLTLRCRGSR